MTNFEASKRTLDTLAELLNNFLSMQIRSKVLSTDNDKNIRIDRTPAFDHETRGILRKWTQSNLVLTQ